MHAHNRHRQGPALAALSAAVMAVFSVSAPVGATNLNLQDYFVRDYLDFAQNKGIFKPGATGLTITKKDGSVFALPDVPFIDFSAGSNDGTSTSVGGAYIVTANHYFRPSGPLPVVNRPVYDCTTYQFVEKRDHGDYSADFAAERLSKFVVETAGAKTVNIGAMTMEEALERFGVEVDGVRQLIGIHAGTGAIQFSDDRENGAYADFEAYHPYPNHYQIGNDPVFKNGSFFTVTDNGVGRWNFYAQMALGDFINRTTNGDSGSGFYLYDAQTGEWLLAGTLYGTSTGDYQQMTNTIINHIGEDVIQALRADYETNVALEGETLVFASGSGSTGTDVYTLPASKDIVLSGGGTIELASDMLAGNSGGYGLIFDGNQSYAVTGEHAYQGAGLDVGEGTVVDWNVTGVAGDSMHKIGAGTVKINVAQGNTLRIGEGTAELNAAGAFDGIYMTSGRGTVKLDRADALAGGTYGGIFFSQKGGTLDLNGFDFTAEKIAASDIGATVTNTSETRSTVRLTSGSDYAYHGTLTGNLNLTNHAAQGSDGHLILDGGTDISGEISAANTHLVLQGKPVTHAVFTREETVDGDVYLPEILDRDTALAEAQGRDWMVSNESSSFDQPDWETRTFRAEKIVLAGADLTIGRNAEVYAAIDATGAHVTLGGGTVWRDLRDGDNITDDGFGFRQELDEGTSDAPETVVYEGKISAVRSDIESYLRTLTASFSLSGSTFADRSGQATVALLQDGVTLTSGSTLEARTLVAANMTDPVSVRVDNTSSLNIRELKAVHSTVILSDASEKNYSLTAGDHATMRVDDWTYRNGNLYSDATSSFSISHLTAAAGESIDADVSIVARLDVKDMSASQNVPLYLRKLTLGSSSVVGVSFDEETVSARNYALDTAYTVVEAGTLTDNRTNKALSVTLPGEGIRAVSGATENTLTVLFKENITPPDPGDRPDPGPSDERAEAVKAKLTDRERAMLAMIEDHNANALRTDRWQEVAVLSALSNEDADAGAEALRTQALRRTDATMERVAQTADAAPLLAVVAKAVDTRVATRSMKYHERRTRGAAVWADTEAGYMKEGDGNTKSWRVSVGFDRPLDTAWGHLTAGMTATAAQVDRKGDGWDHDATVMAVGAYGIWKPSDMFEWDAALTLMHASGDAEVKPEAYVEAQTLDAKTTALLWQNTVKTTLWTDEDAWTVRPLVRANAAYWKTDGSSSQYFRREKADGIRVDLGLGMEAEYRHRFGAQRFEASVRKNVVNTGDETDVKLASAGTGAFSYDVREKHDDAVLDLAWHGNYKLSRNTTVQGSFTASAGTGSVWGAAGSVGVQYRW